MNVLEINTFWLLLLQISTALDFVTGALTLKEQINLAVYFE